MQSMLIMVEQEFDLDGDGGLDEEEFMGLYNQVLVGGSPAA